MRDSRTRARTWDMLRESYGWSSWGVGIGADLVWEGAEGGGGGSPLVLGIA